MALRTIVSLDRSIYIRRHCSKAFGRLLATLTDGAKKEIASVLNRWRRQQQRAKLHWLTYCAGIWIREGVFVAFFASIETSDILFNQEPE